MTTYSESFRVWSNSRYKIAAIREIDEISVSKGENLVVVAGAGHAYHAVKRMKEKGISYQVVMPTGADESRIDLQNDPVVIENQRLQKALACLPTNKKPIQTFEILVKIQVEKFMDNARATLQKLEK